MAGVLYKDFIHLKKEFRLGFTLLMFLPAIAGLSNPQFFLPIFGILMALYWGTFVLSGLGKDEAASWRKNSMSFPITKSKLVGEKYLFSFILNLIAFSLVFAIGSLMKPLFHFAFREVLLYSTSAGIFSLIFCTLVIPLAFRFGVESCRYFLFGFASLPGVIMVLMKWLNIDYWKYLNSVKLSNEQFILLTSLFLFIWIGTSFYLSFRWYEKFS